MRTKFPFKISIDDQEFSLEYKELNKAGVKALTDEIKSIKSKTDEIEAIKSDIQALEEKKSLDMKLIDALEGEEKVAAIKEVKAAIAQICALNKKLKKAGEEELDIDVVAKKRFDMCVSGADAAALVSCIEAAGISYTSLIGEIDKAIEKERSKK
ncbi:hypothetical protein [Campylobacter sp. RM16187]|uniref:hypothetical protein n=1 Tax=Campylobacter sp. RM16187 TaxID=1660063 RepID=UPI0021B5CB7A|nr:hypothetical protein [Campylobacter sp. RM16187]QKG29728.1 hypothetical protein CDOMF_1491 [Campylobacter sp. RM16187]